MTVNLIFMLTRYVVFLNVIVVLYRSSFVCLYNSVNLRMKFPCLLWRISLLQFSSLAIENRISAKNGTSNEATKVVFLCF